MKHDMVELLRELVEIESPTGDSEGIRRLGARIALELAGAGAEVRLLGDNLVGELAGDGEPVLLLGHLDTVWARGTLERMPWRVQDGRAYGPGSYDMKAGIVVIVEALRQATARKRPVCVFPQRRRGSRQRPGTAVPRRGGARRGGAAFVVEPCLPGGGLKTVRKGLGVFRLRVRGRAAHAGTHPHEGASAIDELARQVLRLHALGDHERGITVNVGVVEGGTRENVVAAYAEANIDARVLHAADAAPLEEAIRSLAPELEGTELEIEGGYTRPPLEPVPATARLVAKAREHGRALGLDLAEGGSGGGSDGNLVGALGVPVLDGLGPDGAGAHATNEHVLLDSLPVRAALLARILEEPGI